MQEPLEDVLGDTTDGSDSRLFWSAGSTAPDTRLGVAFVGTAQLLVSMSSEERTPDSTQRELRVRGFWTL